MPIHPANKYHLRDLHKEIDFLDRKISYCQQFEEFTSEKERAAAVHKLTVKREPLVKAALDLASRGVEYDPARLPRSFKAMESASQEELAS